ncbi:hypothetical protein ACIQC7_35095 [Kitasatospora sp. NPDC088556]|uniref:hypothetical protein n=1 Tax=Kitasatospora sp. NPDC088556 TaxID=3364076 RepID=UPI0037F6BC7C
MINPYVETQTKLSMAVLLVLDASKDPVRHDRIAQLTGTADGSRRKVALYDAIWEWERRGVVRRVDNPGDIDTLRDPLWTVTPVGELRTKQYRRELSKRFQDNAGPCDRTLERPRPKTIINAPDPASAKQLVFHFHDIAWFATWTVGERLLTVYNEEGAIVDLYGWSRAESAPTAFNASAAAELFGPLADVTYNDSVYPRAEEPLLTPVWCGQCGCAHYYARPDRDFGCGKCGGSTDPVIDLVLEDGQTWAVDAEGRLYGSAATNPRLP